jgi:sugar fermentation stimulation protein A
MITVANSHPAAPTIVWPPLLAGTLERRYKRFLADVKLPDGRRVTIHCPNSGSMRACSQPGRPVYLSASDNPRRKLKYTWELIEMPTSLVGVNTQVPNRLVRRSAEATLIPELGPYANVRREVQTAPGTRLDLCLTGTGRRSCYVEIKNCTLVENGQAFFPDARTVRGLKHLHQLIELVKNGTRGIIFYLIQRMDASRLHPADHIDPAYGEGLRQALAAGVEALAYDVHIDLTGISLRRRLEVHV